MHATRLNYDPLGRLTTTANALQQMTTLTDYTSANLPQHITLPNGQRVTLEYDDQKRMISLARGDQTEREETHIHYFNNGLVSPLQLANGSEFHFTYNAARQTVCAKRRLVSGAVGAVSPVAGIRS